MRTLGEADRGDKCRAAVLRSDDQTILGGRARGTEAPLKIRGRHKPTVSSSRIAAITASRARPLARRQRAAKGADEEKEDRMVLSPWPARGPSTPLHSGLRGSEAGATRGRGITKPRKRLTSDEPKERLESEGGERLERESRVKDEEYSKHQGRGN